MHGEFAELRERICALKALGGSQTSTEQNTNVRQSSDTGLVIKNLNEETSEKTDKNNRLLNKLKTLFKEGLKLEVRKSSVERNTTRTTYPGLGMVKLENKNQKTLVLRAKRMLCNTDRDSDVYNTETELLYEARQQQRNTRMLLKAVGKEEKFHYSFSKTSR